VYLPVRTSAFAIWRSGPGAQRNASSAQRVIDLTRGRRQTVGAMSDYQDVTVIEADGARLVLEVVETHPDMPLLRRLEDDAEEVRTFAAMLLLEVNGRGECALATYAAGLPEIDPKLLVASATLRDVMPNDPASTEQEPLCRARLEVLLVDEEHAGDYPVGATWGAAGDPAGDLDDYLG